MERYAGIPKANLGDAKRILEWVNSQGDPLRLYREVVIPKGQKLDTEKLGLHWTPDRNKAHSPFAATEGLHGERKVLEIVVARDQVDEAATIAAMRRYPDESEVTLKDGAVGKLEGIGKVIVKRR